MSAFVLDQDMLPNLCTKMFHAMIDYYYYHLIKLQTTGSTSTSACTLYQDCSLLISKPQSAKVNRFFFLSLSSTPHPSLTFMKQASSLYRPIFTYRAFYATSRLDEKCCSGKYRKAWRASLPGFFIG